MVYEDLSLERRQPLYRRCSWAKKKYGVGWKPRDLFYRLRDMAKTRRGFTRPVLSSRDGSWALHSLFWKQAGTRPDKKGYYLSGSRWYVRGVRGLSFKTEAEVKHHLAEPSPFTDFQEIPREQCVGHVVTKDWAEDTSFNQISSYDGF